MSEGASRRKTHSADPVGGRLVRTHCGRGAASVDLVTYPTYPSCGSCDRSIRASARRAAVLVLGEEQADAVFLERATAP